MARILRRRHSNIDFVSDRPLRRARRHRIVVDERKVKECAPIGVPSAATFSAMVRKYVGWGNRSSSSSYFSVSTVFCPPQGGRVSDRFICVTYLSTPLACTAVAKAARGSVSMADMPAMIGALADGLLRRLNDLCGHAVPLEVAHACPPSDPCAGSDAAHAWADIGFVSVATLPRPPWSSKRYAMYIN